MFITNLSPRFQSFSFVSHFSYYPIDIIITIRFICLYYFPIFLFLMAAFVRNKNYILSAMISGEFVYSNFTTLRAELL